MSTAFKVDHITKLVDSDFRVNYIDKNKPALISNMLSNWGALIKWTPEYFASLSPELLITTKKFDTNNSICKNKLTLSEYVNYLDNLKKVNHCSNKSNELLYWHDVPLFSEIPELVSDVSPFFLNIIPTWYSHQWWRYVQFFVGPKNCVTPLHFDCLLTNNLFFQITGKKKFILIPYKDSKYCEKYGWRWFDVDPENPNYNRVPEFQKTNPIEVIVGPGDILYIPSGTLHYVKSLDASISFNIDFHTKRSLMRSFRGIFKGMPLQNIYYNAICALGIIGKVPSKYLFKYYKSYLNYVS